MLIFATVQSGMWCNSAKKLLPVFCGVIVQRSYFVQLTRQSQEETKVPVNLQSRSKTSQITDISGQILMNIWKSISYSTF